MSNAIRLRDEISFFERRYHGYLDQELLSDDTVMFSEDKIKELIESTDSFFLSDKVIERPDLIIIFCKYEKEAILDDARSKIETLIEKYKKVKKCLVISYFRRIEDKLVFNEMISKITLKKLYLRSIIKCNYTGRCASLKVDRFNTIQMPETACDFNAESEKKKCSNVQGYAFSASLVDLIELYNTIGDELFDQNLRYQIGDVLGVNSAIKETLENNPQNFWFLNNGVTICLTGEDIVLNSPRQIMLSSKIEAEPPEFSVINGAQTISTAAELYYSLIEEKRKVIREEAKVLVKVIVVSPKKATGDLEASSIAIALNRQKPIKDEDIAYTYPFVECFNSYCTTNKKEIQIIKRGESREKGSIDLVTFARIMKALELNPQESRNSSAKTLLKSNGENFTGIRGSKELTDSNIDQDETYNKYFCLVPAVNNVIEQKKYSELLKSIKKDISEDEYSFLNNGKWFFISEIFKASYKGAIGDCSGFNENEVETFFDNKDLMKEYLIRFAKKLSSLSPGVNTDSFKGVKLKNQLKDVDLSFQFPKTCYLKG